VLGEPPFDMLGLASWWPSGRAQLFMEWIHVDLGLQWWQTIMVTTVCMRLLVFPVVVKAQRNLAKMTNINPVMAKLQGDMTDARRRGDMLEFTQLSNKLNVLMKNEGINPIKNIIPIVVQASIFISMFFALRGMSNLPIESMKDGGCLWFNNLTLMDPYVVLPVATSISLFLQMKSGAEGLKLDQLGRIPRILMTAMPVVMIIFTYKFPAAICLYWMTSNFISLSQAKMLKLPKVRKVLNIPEMVKPKEPQAKSGKSNKGFVEGFRESIDNSDFLEQMKKKEFGREYDEKMFRKAGTETIKTFKYDPTKPVQIKFKGGK